MVIVAMTTIGYGDYYPTTHLGRITTIVACIWGVFLLSLFVVALTMVTDFKEQEKEAFNTMVKHSDIKGKLKVEALILIKHAILLYFMRKKNWPILNRWSSLMGFLNSAKRFKTKRLQKRRRHHSATEGYAVPS